MQKSTISLCMIVKNEEKRLPDCLESARGAVDQIVVVDTGSTDGTVEIARSYGAEVFFFPWSNDFSAARNESLRHASGDWILWMDADERLNGLGAPNCLLDGASTSGADAYYVPIRSPKLEGGFDFHYAIRFFRHFPGIHFVGEVHEFVDPFLLEKKARIVRAQFLIEHLGYAVDASKMEEKRRRNLLLLRKSFERDPDNAYILYGLGRTLLGLKQEEESLEMLQRALRAKGLTSNLHASALNLITFFHLSSRDYVKAEETASASLEAVKHQSTARLLLGIAYYNLERYDLAAPNLLYAYRFYCRPPEKRLTEVSEEHSFSEADVLRALAISYAKLEQYGDAVAFAQRYIQRVGQDAEITKLIGICYLNAGNSAQAAFYLQKAEEMGVSPDSTAIPLACAHFALGNIERAQEHLLKADEDGFTSTEGKKLLEAMVTRYFESNRAHDACRFLDRLALQHPNNPEVLDALGIAWIKAGDFRKAIAVHEKLAALAPESPAVIRRLAALFAGIGDTGNARLWLSRM